MKWLRKIYLRCDRFKCSTKRFSFFTELNCSHVILLYLAKCGLILPNWTGGLLGWAPNKVLATTVEQRGKGGGISRRRQSLKGGGDCRNWLPILKLPRSGDRKNITEPWLRGGGGGSIRLILSWHNQNSLNPPFGSKLELVSKYIYHLLLPKDFVNSLIQECTTTLVLCPLLNCDRA